jgi:hypothetical protein
MPSHRIVLFASCLVTAITLAGSDLEGQAVRQAGAPHSALLYHDSASFFVDPPRGWVIDASELARAQGPIALFYRRGESWRTGDAVMYANVITLKGSGPNALATTIREEVARWSAAAGDAVVTSLPDIRSNTDHIASVRKFVSRNRRTHEAVAYIRQGSVVPLLVLIARSEAALAGAYPDFERLVKSYGPGPVISQRR